MIYRNSEKHNKHSHKETTGKSGKKAEFQLFSDFGY